MNKIKSAAIATSILAVTSFAAVPAHASGTYVYNKPQSTGAFYSYSGSGCTGTATYFAAGKGKTVNAKSYKAHFTYAISWNGGPSLIRNRNTCVTVNAGSVTALVGIV